MALALDNLKRVDMPLNKETKPNNKHSHNFPNINAEYLADFYFLKNRHIILNPEYYLEGKATDLHLPKLL